MADVLNEDEVREALQARSAWGLEDGAIKRSVEAPSFLAGIGIVDEVAQAAEAAGHHPDIDIRWTTVTFALVTHSAGGLTNNDFEMAGTIDEILTVRL